MMQANFLIEMNLSATIADAQKDKRLSYDTFKLWNIGNPEIQSASFKSNFEI